jgi:hypothetical protein
MARVIGRRAVVLGGAGGIGFGCMLRAGQGLASPVEPLGKPKGPVILTVAGDIRCTNVGPEAQFDRSMIESLGPVTLRTTTIWTEGVQEFTGVPLARVLEVVEAGGGMIDALAINDYWAEIPVSDATESGPILAYLMNGQPMSRRDKGPLWVIYPYDADPSLHSEDIYARSVWQLRRMEIRD